MRFLITQEAAELGHDSVQAALSASGQPPVVLMVAHPGEDSRASSCLAMASSLLASAAKCALVVQFKLSRAWLLSAGLIAWTSHRIRRFKKVVLVGTCVCSNDMD